jgi:hypothetical protein
MVKINLDDLILYEYSYYDEGFFYEGRYVKKRYNYIKFKKEQTLVFYNGLYTNNDSYNDQIIKFSPNFSSKYLSTSISIFDMLQII